MKEGNEFEQSQEVRTLEFGSVKLGFLIGAGSYVRDLHVKLIL